MTKTPTHGFTRSGHAVHAKTSDHYKSDTRYQRANKRIAVGITKNVGTMTSAYLFCVLALASLPAVLSGFSIVHGSFPSWLVSVSVIALIAWIAQTFLQLVLLPIIIVGQNVQAEASDARAAKTFEDVERLVKALDLRYEGGITELRDELTAHIDSKFPVKKAPVRKAVAKKTASPAITKLPSIKKVTT